MPTKRYPVTVLVAIFFMLCLGRSALAADLSVGDGSFRFTGWPTAPLTVWYTLPEGAGPETPVIVVMHGLKRNGEDYRDGWAGLARRHGFILLVPEIPADRFPKAAGYNLGNVFAADGTRNPPDQWSFGALDPIFDHVKNDLGLSAEGYGLYGHSAGAQFVHRFMLFQKDNKVLRAVAANAGWYTMPQLDVEFPYGLKNSGIDGAGLDAYLGQRMTVLLGDQDTDPQARYLRRTPEALAQGPHRFARGQSFYNAGRTQAEERDVEFAWRIAAVPGVGHSNSRMAPYAVNHLIYGAAVQPGPVCRFNGVTFRADFSGGRLNGCEQTGPQSYSLTIGPEVAPVNPSPWYAFTASADQDRTVDVTLRYAHGRHRYWPKTGTDPFDLEPMPEEAVNIAEDRQSARFSMALDERLVYVAAQDLIRAEDYDRWLKDHDKASNAVVRRTIGKSREGRLIEALETGAEDQLAIVLVGRQHPPEVTGAQAMSAFSDRVLADDPLAQQFRDRFRLLIIPNLNPDGVARGHWRTNAAGVDLNRDWGPFTQPESRAARDAIINAAGEKGDRLVLFLDFHSTRRDVFYTQHDGFGSPGIGLTASWLAAIDNRLPGYTPVREAQHNGGATNAKSWIHETFRIPAITYEVGDETSGGDVRTRARVAAEEIMKLLLGDE